MSMAKIIAKLVERGEEDLAEELLSVSSEQAVAKSKLPWEVESWHEELAVQRVVKDAGLKISKATFHVNKQGAYMSFTVSGGVITEEFFWEMRKALGGSKTSNPGNWLSGVDGKLDQGKSITYTQLFRS